MSSQTCNDCNQLTDQISQITLNEPSFHSPLGSINASLLKRVFAAETATFRADFPGWTPNKVSFQIIRSHRAQIAVEGIPRALTNTKATVDTRGNLQAQVLPTIAEEGSLSLPAAPRLPTHSSVRRSHRIISRNGSSCTAPIPLGRRHPDPTAGITSSMSNMRIDKNRVPKVSAIKVRGAKVEIRHVLGFDEALMQTHRASVRDGRRSGMAWESLGAIAEEDEEDDDSEMGY